MRQGRHHVVERAWCAALAAYVIFAVAPMPVPGASVFPKQFGPYDTAFQQGYEPSNIISPIVPTSYSAIVSPHIVGMQFLASAETNLQRDHFTIQIQGEPPGAPNVFWNGLVGSRLAQPLDPGTYRVIFHIADFDMNSPTWTITVRGGAVPRHARGTPTATLLASLNTVRQTLGLSPAHQNLALDRASLAHAQYLSANGFAAPSFHVESSAHAGFTGVNPWNRDLYFGWPTPETGEVGVEWSIPTKTATVMSDLIDTVFHRLCLLSGNLESVGAGSSSGPNGAVVMDLGYGYRANLPHVIVYPFAGQPGLPTSWTDIESPDPVRGGYDHRYGYPITVDYPTVDQLSQVRVQVLADDRPVPVVVDPPGVGDLGDNQVGVVPQHPLSPCTWYEVQISGRAVFASGTSRVVTTDWKFATGASDQSLSATLEPVHHLVVADVVCGSGVPCSDQPLTLYRRGAHGSLTPIAQGRTNSDGLWDITVKKFYPGYYEVMSRTKNAVVFWWGG
ncbi:MAG: CAP domain-containing protein [Sulfobacillus acidophilus]|uniref:CAP domain-containing protein n=1 Tax=Sulfobacillus acidophilus TaxID=53633 RepID=A0A2T2WJM9_9FIRM|nr:MAG: CAP domain-containing protein [Sulfobacillus acidophilus]